MMRLIAVIGCYVPSHGLWICYCGALLLLHIYSRTYVYTQTIQNAHLLGKKYELRNIEY